MRIEIEERGTRQGIHWYCDLMTCSRKRFLADQLLAQGVVQKSAWKPEAGTLLHALLAKFYGKKLRNQDTAKLVYSQKACAEWEPDIDAVTSAAKAFRAYRLTYKPDEWKVLEIEKQHKTSLFGVPFTYRPDLIVEVKSLKKVLAARRGPLWIKGKYIVDHKLVFSDDPRTFDNLLFDLQMPAYQKATGIKNGIFNIIIIGKSVKFRTLLSTYNENSERILEGFFKQAERLLGQEPEGNPLACINKYGAFCPFYLSRECGRF